MAQAYPENRQITDSLPHHYGPKTDRRIWAVMSHNAELVGYWLHASPPAAQRMAKCESKADPPNSNWTSQDPYLTNFATLRLQITPQQSNSTPSKQRSTLRRFKGADGRRPALRRKKYYEGESIDEIIRGRIYWSVRLHRRAADLAVCTLADGPRLSPEEPASRSDILREGSTSHDVIFQLTRSAHMGRQKPARRIAEVAGVEAGEQLASTR
jgi:hypothetical protein